MKSIFLFPVLVAVAAGCAHEPPKELLDARAAYADAQKAPGAPLVVNDMRDAQLSLADAEKRFKDDGDSKETRDVSYVAQKRAVAAHAKGDAMANLEEKKRLEADFSKWKDKVAMATREQLTQTKSALGAAQANADAERAGRIAAEQRANAALLAMKELQAKESEKGLVLTLSGSVLFKTNTSTLLPDAEKRLNDIAVALKEDKRNIVVYGFTDSTGTDAVNQKLSEDRAASVRSYLVKQGVPSERITSEGKGKSDPIADNATPEGRANNRRVEIVLKKSDDAAK